MSQWKLKVKTNKLSEARDNAENHVGKNLALNLIGWERSESLLDQSESDVKHNQSNPGLLSTLD